MAIIVADIQVSEFKEDGVTKWQAIVDPFSWKHPDQGRVVSTKSPRDAAKKALRFVTDSSDSRIDALA